MTARRGARWLLLAPALALLPGPAAAQPIGRWEPQVAEASARFGIPPRWIWRVIDAESAGRTTRQGRPIRSRVGAMGLMQLMPGTWRAMRRAHGLGADPDDPRDNILAGTAYLRRMYDRFGYPGLFAAYNAGPARYADHLARSRPLPAETVAYVARVTGRAAAGSSAQSPVSGADSVWAVRGAGSRRQSAPAVPRADTVFFAVGGSAPD